MPDYDDHIRPPERTESAISKSIGQMALTMGLFVGGQALAMMGFSAGKSKAFQHLAKLPKGAGAKFSISAAAKHAQKRGNSLTAFLSKITKKDSVVGKLSRGLDEGSNNAIALQKQKDWADRGLSRYEKYQEYKKLDKFSKTDMKTMWGARYARETAFLMPTFYMMEQGIGHVTPGPEHKERPAWYNLPAHAIGMAKYAPLYLAGDAVGRGVFKAVGAGMGYLADRVAKNVPSVVQEGVVRTADYLRKGSYLEKQVGIHKVRDYAAGVGATKDAFVHAVLSRPKMLLATQKTMSKMERSGKSFRNVRKSFADEFTNKFDVRFKQRLDAYTRRKSRAGKSTVEALENDFDDFLDFANIGVFHNSSEYARVVGASKSAIDEVQTHLKKSFFNENRKLPYMARLLGLRRAKGSDYAENKTLGKVYDKMAKVVGGGKPMGMEKPDFVKNILAKDKFFHEASGKIVDIAPMGPKYWTDKMLHSKLMVLGNKASIADLFPFKVFSSKEMHRVMTMDEMTALHPSSQVGGDGVPRPFQQGLMDGSVGSVSHKNIHTFKKGTPGLVVRKAGDKSYNLLDFDPDKTGGWNVIGKNLKAGLITDSPKLANVFIKGQIRTADIRKMTGDAGQYSPNPIVGWMQKHLSLFDNKGESPSLFNRARMFLPDSWNKMLSPGDKIPYSHHRAKTTMQQLAKVAGMDIRNLEGMANEEKEQVLHMFSRVRSLGSKMAKESFDDTLVKDEYMSNVIDFLSRQRAINKISGRKAINESDSILDIASQLMLKQDAADIKVFGEDKAVKNIIKSMKVGGRGVEGRGGFGYGEEPLQKVKRFIYEYAVYHSETQSLTGTGDDIFNILTSRLKSEASKAKVSPNEIAKAEFGMFYDKLRYSMRKAVDGPMLDDEAVAAAGSKELQKAFEKLIDPDTHFLDTVRKQLIKKNSVSGPGSVLDEFTGQLGMFDNTWARNTSFSIDDLTATAGAVRNANPFVLYPGDFKSQAGLAFGWAGSTVNKLISFSGLGWDSSRYNTGGDVTKLWGKRLGAFAGATLGYSALDTFVDTSGLFDWTMFDEGLTVGLADQAVKARLAAGWAYDKMGIDNVSRYFEGMMPGFTKVAPGAAMGFAMGGVKGAVIGGLANAYLQPQLEEGPLSFLAAVPGANFFVTDPTMGFDEIQDVYEGQRMLPVRKGRGWTLGITPIAGGRVERYEPGWYPRLKSQYKASPTLYGSKLEQFLAKDVPFVDFSLMDLVDPHYLEYKHMTDRPYPVASTPFAEVPVAGPLLSSTVGQLYNFIHPLGEVGPMQEDRAMRQYMKGTSTNWRGESLGTYGPQYGGFLGAYNEQNNLPGNATNTSAIMSPHSLKPLIGEQVYKGWIEPLGLPGFITSAALWGGDEPFTHIPVAESANAMDSLTRSYWDANIGDLVGTTELLRRAIPRPRTSYEKVNPLRNDMPGWMPETMQTGDPYCLHPETLVETNEGLIRADQVEETMLLRTLNGHYHPVNKLSTRPVDEEIYKITIKGLEDFPLKTTGGHPFYIDGDWKFAKDLAVTDKTSYPLLDIELPAVFEVSEKEQVKLTGLNSYILGLMTRWIIPSNNSLKFRKETPVEIQQEIKTYYAEHVKLFETIKYLQYTGVPPHLRTSDLYILLNYIKAFIVQSETDKDKIVFRFHSKNAAYVIWSSLLQHRIASKIDETALYISGNDAAELAYEMGLLDIKSKTEMQTTFDGAFETIKHAPIAMLEIASIEKEHYKGLVYTIDMGEPGTYSLPGAAVHNSKIAHGELLLPGDAYENFFNPELDFPVGMSRLGYNPYEQAMSMIGLGHMTLDQEEILEEGSAIHAMVQNQLMSTGAASRVEALISDPAENIRSYVDVMYRDLRTQQELPLEIKSIGGKGFANLEQPKWKHRVQLNSYMATMGVSQGKFLYVSREDPTQTKEFAVRFDPDLWSRTKANLHEARHLAQEYLQQGYGYANEAYSYIDRLRVLMNAAPYSKEYRETSQLLEEQVADGYVTPQEEEEFSILQKQHKTILRKYEMYPRRFQVSELLNPDDEYPDDLSLNPFILPADQYNLVERIAGSAWETLTHKRSPIHTKLIGAYSPMEKYEDMMIRGDFASWTTPVESFVKPWGRGLAAASDPLQGALSFGTGGALLGGLPGAVAGTVIGAVYGGAHGLHRAMSDSEYRPGSFQERVEMQEYFDKLEYSRAMQMYRATQDEQYRKQMQKTQHGWLDYMQQSQAKIEAEASAQNSALRRTNNPAFYGVGSDRGFGSPWQGSDERTARLYNTAFYKGYSALPSWDRPFWSALVETTEADEQEKVLRRVDSQMGDMLKMMWGRGEDVNLPTLDSYFSNKRMPSALNPVMDPTVEQEDIQMVTVEDYGMNAHDFGMGWRQQLNRIKSSHFDIQPLNINAEGSTPQLRTDMSGPEIRDAIQKVLTRMGYNGANVSVSSMPSLSTEVEITLNVKRTSAKNIIEDYYGTN